jgi:hypothetical protein
MSNSRVSLAAFVKSDESIRIHAAGCSHTLRETRLHGMPIVMETESRLGLIRALKAQGIRSNDLYFLQCIGVPESFAILAPNGERVSAASSRKAATKASGRIRREARQELAQAINGLSTFARQMMDSDAQS